MKTYLCGIDPDIFFSGFSIKLKGARELLVVTTLPFYDVIDNIGKLSIGNKLIVYLDAGWLNKKSNFHSAQGAAVREKIASNVGANAQVGKLFADYCLMVDVEHYLIRPTKSKMNAEFFKKATGWQGVTNSEMRDSAALIIGR